MSQRTEHPSAADTPPAGDDHAPLMPSRRNLLKGAGVTAATVVVAGAGVGSYRAFDNGVLNAGEGAAYDPWRHWRNDPGPLGTVGAAILAANPHNTQPWAFHVAGSGVDVFADASRRTGALDPLGRETQVGLGCALENLVLAAQARGYVTRVTLMPVPGDPTHVARVGLAPATIPPVSPLYQAIGRRHSNRGPYRSQPVPGEMLTALTRLGDGLPGTQVRWFTGPVERARLGALLVDAATAIVADRQQSVDGFAWFRSSRDAIDRHRDGLTLDGQGLSDVMTAVAKLLPTSSRSAGDQFWLDQTRTVHTKTAAAYGMVTVADPDDPVQRLTGGRLLERIHLAATVRGLALQHMNQITERVDREASLGRPASFGPRLQALLAQPGQRALATFRVGYPIRTARLSPRRPVEDVAR